MTQPRNTAGRPRAAAVSVRAAAEHSRRARLRRTERRLVAQLDDLYRTDRPGYRALVRALRDVVTHETRRGR